MGWLLPGLTSGWNSVCHHQNDYALRLMGSYVSHFDLSRDRVSAQSQAHEFHIFSSFN